MASHQGDSEMGSESKFLFSEVIPDTSSGELQVGYIWRKAMVESDLIYLFASHHHLFSMV